MAKVKKIDGIYVPRFLDEYGKVITPKRGEIVAYTVLPPVRIDPPRGLDLSKKDYLSNFTFGIEPLWAGKALDIKTKHTVVYNNEIRPPAVMVSPRVMRLSTLLDK